MSKIKKYEDFILEDIKTGYIKLKNDLFRYEMILKKLLPNHFKISLDIKNLGIIIIPNNGDILHHGKDTNYKFIWFPNTLIMSCIISNYNDAHNQPIQNDHEIQFDLKEEISTPEEAVDCILHPMKYDWPFGDC